MLRLTASKNLTDAASVKLLNGGKLYLNSGVRTRVAELVLDGEPQPTGIYRAANRPQYIAGPGSVVVGRPGGVILLR